ncbi:MAG: amino acid adenylation domain-containing protein, partial [Methylococcales bacterium]|nr:amino acid adenylation domain-containing protein [Methylococcales bacterium]
MTDKKNIPENSDEDSHEDRELLIAQLLEEEGSDEFHPLTSAQEQLWFLDQLQPGNAAYHMPAAVRITGQLDREILQTSLNEIINRHDVLVSNFRLFNGQPVQFSQDHEIELTVQKIDCQLVNCDKEEVDGHIRTLASKIATEPFDLKNDLLLRAKLFKIKDDHHVLMIVLHHIIADGGSIALLINELSSIYESLLNNQPDTLDELEYQYIDFAYWQKEYLESEEYQASLNYWKQQLEAAPPVLSLPTDYPRPINQSFHGQHEIFHISAALVDELLVIANQQGATLFMVLLAAFQVMLSRYINQEDICVGTPVAGRNQDSLNTDKMSGLFVNMLVMRLDLSGDPSFKELLNRTKKMALDGYAHQDVPFANLVEELSPERSTSHAPIFQVMIALQNYHYKMNVSGLQFESIAFESGTSRYDITLDLTELEKGIEASFEYNTDLFSKETIVRMASHYEILLRGIVADYSQPISELPMPSTKELIRLIVDWNKTEAETSPVACFHQLFEQQAEKTPDNSAVVFQGQSWSYRQLNEKANQLAHFLKKQGVGVDVLVGIYMDRSLEMLATILAIHKAGGAYVPLDPAYPVERLAYMLENSTAPVLLTQASLMGSVPDYYGTVINYQAITTELDQQDKANCTSDFDRKNLAYVIYTSGSTGKPKGVQIKHGGLLNFLESMKREPGLNKDDTLLAVTSLSFDIATLELFLPLITGAKIVLASREVAIDAARLQDLLKASNITIMQATPATWRMLLNRDCQLKHRIKILCGGEAMPTDLAGQLLMNSNVDLWNMYGPTETTVWSCIHHVTTLRESIPIGRPIANTLLYILDKHQHPAPIGVPGELFIGGEGVARGYRGRDDLTAERFIENPFNDEHEVIYQTGDLARYLPNGEIECLGRIDHQVKLRGYRIELGEIEAVLSSHPDVHACIVILREDSPGNKRLVGYAVAKKSLTIDGHKIKQAIKQELPDYMIPSIIVAMQALPLLPNGKINRQFLPKPDQSLTEREIEQPVSMMEKAIAGLWEQILEVSMIGRQDNFFALGGHSLLATQLIAKIRDHLKVELPLRILFEASTLAELATAVENKNSQNIDAPAIIPVSREQVLPLSFAQERLWFLDQLEPGNPIYNIPVVIRITGDLNVNVLHQSLQTIIQRHEALRTVFKSDNGQPSIEIFSSMDFELPVTDIRGLNDDEKSAHAEQLALKEVRHQFNLERGPLIKCRLIQEYDQQQLLVITMHHIISDGWSGGVFFQEINALYSAYCHDEVSPLADLSIQVADIAYWQRQWLQGDVLEKQLNYWKKQLTDFPVLMNLPLDFNRPAIQTFNGDKVSLRITKDKLNVIKQLAQQQEVTLFMLLLSVWNLLLAKHCRQTDLCVGIPVAGRNHTETQNLIGFFVNSLVIRSDLSENLTIKEFIQQIKNTVLDAFDHQDLPFEQLVDEVSPNRNLSYSPIVQVGFALQNDAMDVFNSPDIQLENIEIH